MVNPDGYVSPDADVEAVNMRSFLEISSEKGTMIDDNADDGKAYIPKGKSISHKWSITWSITWSIVVEKGKDLKCEVLNL